MNAASGSCWSDAGAYRELGTEALCIPTIVSDVMSRIVALYNCLSSLTHGSDNVQGGNDYAKRSSARPRPTLDARPTPNVPAPQGRPQEKRQDSMQQHTSSQGQRAALPSAHAVQVRSLFCSLLAHVMTSRTSADLSFRQGITAACPCSPRCRPPHASSQSFTAGFSYNFMHSYHSYSSELRQSGSEL